MKIISVEEYNNRILKENPCNDSPFNVCKNVAMKLVYRSGYVAYKGDFKVVGTSRKKAFQLFLKEYKNVR